MFHQSPVSTFATLADRDLVAEADHRIANSLSSIAGLVRRATDNLDPDAHLSSAAVAQILGEVRTRIDAVARLHRILSEAESGADVDAAAYLQQIAAETVATLADRQSVRLHVVCELGSRIAAERALCLGLIVVELVTNALKYAHPTGVKGAIAVRTRHDPRSLVTEVSDDGVGLPEGFDPMGEKSSGLKLVRALARQAGGDVGFESGDLGLRCRIEVPLN